MTWFAWRQFRGSALTAAVTLAATAVVLASTAHIIADQWSAAGVATCDGDCTSAIRTFLHDVFTNVDGVVYQAATVLVYLVPPLVGIFWGAPLIARELEAGTHRLAWNQSVTRSRWLATKLTIAATAAAATAGLLSWGVSVWGHHIDDTQYFRITPLVYGARGIVPIGYALFALAVGVTMGMLIRRTVPAMAATLGIYVAAIVSMPLWLRSHLIPAVHTTGPLDLHKVAGLLIRPDNTLQVVSGVTPEGAWILSNRTITTAGQLFTGPANPQVCGHESGADACLGWLGTLGLRQDLVYQPASHFWPLQWAETGIFTAAAAVLVAFCFWWTRRRLS